MWNAFVQRRNGGGYNERASLQCIELTDDDCKLLVSAGLKIQKGASPRDLYCFQYLPSYYDGTPLQVLRLLEEARSAGRKAMRRTATATSGLSQESVKRQRLASASASSLLPAWARPQDDVGENDSVEKSSEPPLPAVIKITPSSVKLAPSPVKGGSRGTAMYEKIASPVKPSLATPTKSLTSHTTTPAARRTHRTSMKIDVVSVQEGTASALSSRKRKSEAGSTSTSPLANLFSPKNIRTPSPGLKTRRSSVLKQFETPEQPTGKETPQTSPAPPKRFSTTTTQYTVTTTTTSDVDDDEISDGLVDDVAGDDERACCDVKSVVEPILEAMHRTSSRLQEVWEEVRGMSSSLMLIPVSDLDAGPSVHVADMRDDAVDLLVLEGDPDVDESLSCHQSQVNDLWAEPIESSEMSVQTRRQRREVRRVGAWFSWRLW